MGVEGMGTVEACWPAAPLIPGDWSDLAGPATKELAARIDALPELRRSGRSAARMRARAMPFYRDWLLVEALVRDEEGPFGILTAVFGTEGLTPVTGESDVVHRLNAHHLALTDMDDRLDYLRFFCSATRSADGRFRIVSDAADLCWKDAAEDAAVPEARTRAADVIAPLRAVDAPEDGEADPATEIYEAFVGYGDAIFRSVFALQPSGMVDMQDDEPVMTDLPIRIERFSGPIRLAPGREPDDADPDDEGEGNDEDEGDDDDADEVIPF